ncbi:hypothetical protein SCHPADRAFT_938666 [Schizopora paradoxa]|uniref:F-box domain-containing protein n=1 Tax=Schizopora paradoxa TaxID=27342 RepID=A0A0H2RUN0_9AGAM|nr:hypothetical protein SCHPADRAFT_938666 [Schizopora paradoxa]
MLVLPEDIQSNIFLRLGLKDLTALRRTSCYFQRLISNDKSLWTHILEHETHSRGLLLHPNRSDIASSTAAHLESSLRCAILLRKAYSLEVKEDAPETRPRHNLDEDTTGSMSHLSVFDLSTNVRCCEVFYLPGPALAGIVDDTGHMLRLALTIGTSNPQILVLELGTDEEGIKIQHLAALRGFAYAIYFSESRMVCATKDGDGCPYLLDWRTGHVWKLVSRIPPYVMQMEFQAHANAIAATEWEGFVIVITNKSIQLFDMETSHNGDSIAAMLSFSLDLHVEDEYDGDFVEEASFEAKVNRKSQSGAPLLLFTGRRRDSYSFTGALMMNRGKGGERVPILLEARVQTLHDVGRESQTPSRELSIAAMQSVVGHSFGYVLQVIFSKGDEQHPLEFLILSWSKQTRSRDIDQHLSTLQVSAKMDSEGFPVLHFLTSIDFDDAAGLIVFGTSRGELCLVRFLPENLWIAGALETSLPTLQNSAISLSKFPVSMDLEEFYKHIDDIRAGNIPRALVKKVVETWLPRYERGQISPVWSQDWENYEHVEEWISPSSTWLIPNFSFEKKRNGRALVQAYRILGTKGVITPVAYRVTTPEWVKDSEQVIVRIGKQLYAVYVPFDSAEDVSIAVLPVNFDDTFDSRMLKEFCRDGRNWLRDWFGDGGKYGLGCGAQVAEEVLSFLESHSEILSEMESNPEKWTNSEWDPFHFILD